MNLDVVLRLNTYNTKKYDFTYIIWNGKFMGTGWRSGIQSCEDYKEQEVMGKAYQKHAHKTENVKYTHIVPQM